MPDCSAPVTTAAMAECAYNDFIAASADQAAALRVLRARLPAARQAPWSKAQKAWLGWRTAACDFEASAAAGGSLAHVLRWQCTARLTRERTAALASVATCPEGDVACARP